MSGVWWGRRWLGRRQYDGKAIGQRGGRGSVTGLGWREQVVQPAFEGGSRGGDRALLDSVVERKRLEVEEDHPTVHSSSNGSDFQLTLNSCSCTRGIGGPIHMVYLLQEKEKEEWKNLLVHMHACSILHHVHFKARAFRKLAKLDPRHVSATANRGALLATPG